MAERGSSALRSTWGSLMNTLLSVPEGVGRLGEGAERLGAPAWVGQAGEFLTALGQEAKRDVPLADPRVEGEFWAGTVPSAAGSLLGFAAAWVAGGGAAALGTGMLAEGTALYSESEALLEPLVASGKMTAEEAENRAWGSFVAGLGLGATDAVPLGWMLGRLNRATGGGLRGALRRTLTGGGLEMVQETGQTAGGRTVPFNDRLVARQELGALGWS